MTNNELRTKLTIQKYKTHIGTIINNIYINKYIYDDTKSGSFKYKYECICFCGNVFITDAYRILKGNVNHCGCKSINTNKYLKKHKLNINKTINELTIVDVKYYKYNKYEERFMYVCKCNCGNVDEYSTKRINSKQGIKNCGKCNKIKIEIKINQMLTNNNLTLLSHYDVAKRRYETDLQEYLKYEIECNACKHKFMRTLHQPQLLACPICYPDNKSRIEINCEMFLTNVSHQSHIRIPSKSNIQSKIEIDFLFEEHNVGLELHGLITHATILQDTDDMFIGNKHRTYHLNKTESCEDQNIDLIQFWNTEWIQKPDICKSIILNRLNKPKYRSYARKCVVREIDKSTYDEFMETHHLQGSTRGESVRLGLFYKENDQLVSVMSFGHSRYSGHQWEMFRFAGYVYCQIVGAASKLFKYFIRNYHPDNIVSYSDRRIFNSGGLYDMLGFKFSHNSDPSYWYFKKLNNDHYHKLHHRSLFMKHKLKDKLAIFDPNLSEWENMEMNGYLRVYDCGNKVYIWTG